MPITRSTNQIFPVSPPSPIPTARGSRSSGNDRFADYLDKSRHRPPELTLLESHFPAMLSLAPEEIDFRSLVSTSPPSSTAARNLVARSAKEFGAFRIGGHGISGQELGIVEEEVERVLSQPDGPVSREFVESNRRGEIIPCFRSHKGTLQFTTTAHQLFGRLHSHPKFWIHMKNIANRLDSIVDQVSLALQEHKSDEFKKQIQDTESVICLCRYPHGNASSSKNDGDEYEGSSSSSSSSLNEKNDRFCDHALRFYLPMEHCIFYVQSGRGPLSFDAGPDTIVVTVGKQLEEWSHGEFKCVPAEMIFMPSFQSSQASLSIELKFFHSLKKSDDKIISLTDQILILLCLAFLYSFLLLVFSY